MFSIYDGREAFYQWDLNQKLIVKDSSINEVHFCNRTDDCSLVCKVYEEGGARLVYVPAILLQTPLTIRAYAYCSNYTVKENRFKVIARSKPADYIYTDADYMTVEKAVNKAIEDAINAGAIDAAIVVNETVYFSRAAVDGETVRL